MVWLPAARFGDGQVFMDVETIAPGRDFAEVITQAVSTCELLLAVIGPRWLTATNKDGQRRLDDPDDVVHMEITAALERDITVIPILVDGAVMPGTKELPEGLVGLARRNAFSLRHESFRADADRLLEVIEPILRAAVAAPVTSSRARLVPVAVDPTDVVPEPSAVQRMRHSDSVTGVTFSPDGQLLATGSLDSSVRIWEVASGRTRKVIGHRGLAVFAVAFSPDGQLLATAGVGDRVRISEVASGRERTRVTHQGAVMVSAVAFSPDGQLLATAGTDDTARFWALVR
jgi:hypothetical protein